MSRVDQRIVAARWRDVGRLIHDRGYRGIVNEIRKKRKYEETKSAGLQVQVSPDPPLAVDVIDRITCHLYTFLTVSYIIRISNELKCSFLKYRRAKWHLGS